MLRASRAPKLRSMEHFAEQEIILPDGRWKGLRLRFDRQPYARWYFQAVDSGMWRIIAATGPTQSGKTLHCSIVPLLYHLFEMGETVVFGLPDMKMADDKWKLDILPVLERTRYRQLLPTTGEGSRGGKVINRVIFRNGATLKFMSGGGGDKSRAAFTSRVLVVTEVDGFNTTSETSTETNKLGQLIARTMHFGSQARIYLECTVTVEQGLIWQFYKQGTESQIVSACPECSQFVLPDREHLSGWQGCESMNDARVGSIFSCPLCGHAITPDERIDMNRRAVLVHRGQELDPAGQVQGAPPATEILGFRWTGWHNLFYTPGDLGVSEWEASRDVNEEDAERRQCQFVWCRPHTPAALDLVNLNAFGLQSRQHRWPRGQVPADTIALTVGCDVKKRLLHFVVIAWRPDGRGTVVTYGELEVNSDQLGEERAIPLALRELRDLCEKGWTWEGHEQLRPADQVGIDAGYKDTAVYTFIRECRADPLLAERYWPVKGFGAGQLAGHNYHGPKKTGAVALHVSEDYHFADQPAAEVILLEFDADGWKTFVHNRLACKFDRERDQPGALTLYSAIPKEHLQICKHWTAEKPQIEFVPDKGEVVKWIVVRRANHFLDGTSIACILGHFMGVRVTEEPPPPAAPPTDPAPPGITLPDGRPFSILDRV